MGEKILAMSTLHEEDNTPKGTSVDNHGQGPDDVICNANDIKIDCQEMDPVGPGNTSEAAGGGEAAVAGGGEAAVGGTAGGFISLKYTSLLLSVSFLMLSAAAAMTALYLLKNQSYTRIQNQVDGMSKEITALHCEIQKVKDGWQNFSGKWYYISYDMKNWTESRNDCITLGGDLAIVKRMEINDFILTHGDKWWVGVTDSVEEGTWLWVDNTPFLQEEVSWAYKQPDNFSGEGGDPIHGEDCGLLQTNGMNDVTCRKTFKYTCESHSCRT